MRRIWLLLMLAAAPAQAQEMEGPSPLQLESWSGLVRQLQSEGVSPSQIDWPYFNHICVEQRSKHGEPAYNRCRYDKIRLREDHKNEWNYCEHKAKLAWPSDLTYFKDQEVAGEIHSDGVDARRIIVARKPLTLKQLRSKREYTVLECMETRGWKNPYNWILGKYEP